MARETTTRHELNCPGCDAPLEFTLRTTTYRQRLRPWRWVVNVRGDWADLWAHIWTHEERSK